MAAISDRVTKLSPEKQRLLALLLKEKNKGLSKLPLLAQGRETNVFPLSFAQQRLWFLDQLDPGSPAYLVSRTVRFSGPLDINLLKLTLDEVVRRHEVLRTSFATVEGQPVQVIAPPQPQDVPLVDLSDLSEPERMAEVRRLADEVGTKPFNLEHGPLLRASVLRLSEQEHVALFTMHHISSDGWSMDVLNREVKTIYEAFKLGQPSPLPELTIQYADFAVWQRQWLQGEVLDRQLDYWKKQLAGTPPLIELPTDRPRPPLQTYRGSVSRLRVSPTVVKGLRELCRQEGVTLFMTMLTAFKVLLARYTRQDDIVVGTPISGRTRGETEDLIGFFVNALVLRTEVSDGLSFRQLLSRVRKVVLEAFEHQDVPFEKLVEELQRERHLSYNPLFQVMFSYQTAQQSEELKGVKAASSIGSANVTSKFDLTMDVSELGENLIAELEYSTDLFDEVTIKRMAGHYQRLLQSVVERPDAAVSQLALLSEEEKQQQLVGWNETVTYVRHQTLHELFAARATATPDATALFYEDEQLSYRELNERSNQLAHYLQGLGVGPESLVALCFERSLEMVVALVGVLKAGGAYLPLDPQYPQDRLAFMVKDAGVSLLLTQTRLAEGIGEWAGEQVRVIELEREWEEISQGSVESPAVTSTADNLAYVIYTSGSTGQPKGTLITHYNVTRLLDSSAKHFAFTGADVWTLFHSYAFDFSVWEIWGPLAYGGKLVVVPYGVSRSPHEFYHLLRDQGVTVLNQTPSAFRQLSVVDADARESDRAELKLRLVIFGGEALEWQSLRGWFERHGDKQPQLVNMYGITETTVHVTYREVSLSGLEEASVGSLIGEALDDLQLYLLTPQLDLLPVGVWGELYVGGAGLARGYLKRPELTAQRFVPNPFAGSGERLYRTGDVGRYRADGEIEYMGRADSQVKIRGFRIELGEIESVLSTHAAVKECVVLVREDVPGDQRVVAYLVGENIDISQLRAYLKEKLPDYMVPAAFVILAAMPLTTNGKIDRRALPAPDSEGFVEREYVAPRDALEMELIKIWESVLGVKNVGITEDFFELGGHSMLAVRVFGQIQRVIDIDLPLSILFQAPTIELLAAVVRKRSGTVKVAASSLVELHGEGSLPPLFCVHPGSGNIFCYIEMSRLLGKDQPVYAFQSRAIEEGAAWPSIEQMAASYIELMRGVQPDGPYSLTGLSLGGAVAFEMSRQLEQAGQQVSLLAIIDSPAPSVMKRLPADDILLMMDFAEVMGVLPENIPLTKEEALQLTIRERLDYVLEQGQREGVLPPEITLAGIERLWEVFYKNVRALMVYDGGNYGGKATLFKTADTAFIFSDDGEAMGWEEFIAGGLQVEQLPGTHHTIIKRPHVDILASRLRAHLHESQTEELLVKTKSR